MSDFQKNLLLSKYTQKEIIFFDMLTENYSEEMLDNAIKVWMDYSPEEIAEIRTRGLSGLPWEDEKGIKERLYPDIDLHFVNPKLGLTEYIKKVNQNNLDTIGTRYLHVKEGTNKYFKKDYTYREKFQKMDQVSKSLMNMGISRGDTVALVSVGTPEVEQMIYGLNTLGAKVFLFDPRDTVYNFSEELYRTDTKMVVMLDQIYPKFKDAIKDNGIKNIVGLKINTSFPEPIKTLSNLKTKFSSEGRELNNILKNNHVIPFEEFLKYGKKIDSDLYLPFIENEGAILLTTSGSTGRPKMVELTNENINCLMEQYRQIFNGTPGEVFADEMPPWVSYGFISGMHLPNSLELTLSINPDYDFRKFPNRYIVTKPEHLAMTGLTLSMVIEEVAKRERKRALDLLEKQKDLDVHTKFGLMKAIKNADTHELYDVITNTQERFKISDELQNELKGVIEDLSNNITFMTGGSREPATFRRNSGKFFMDRGGKHTLNGYGCTEGGSCLTTETENCINIESVGAPLPYNKVEVRDLETRELLGYNRKGEIAFSGPSNGRYAHPELHESNLYIGRDGLEFLRPGDIGWQNLDGTIGIEGRIKRMIMADGGYIVPAEKVEEELLNNALIKDAIVVGVSNKAVQQTSVAAQIVLKSDEELTETEEELVIEDIKSKLNLPEHYIPALIKIVDEIKQTNRAKPDYQQIQEVLEQEFNEKIKDISPTNSLGKTISLKRK